MNNFQSYQCDNTHNELMRGGFWGVCVISEYSFVRFEELIPLHIKKTPDVQIAVITDLIRETFRMAWTEYPTFQNYHFWKDPRCCHINEAVK